MKLTRENRRTALKTIGAGFVGTAAFAGIGNAGDTGDNRNQESFTWAEDEIWEMLESEPHGNNDNEGNPEAHRDLWLVAPFDHIHSPHAVSPPAPVTGDHVIPLAPTQEGKGGQFTAQWHVHLVHDPQGPPGALVNSYSGGDLKSAGAIEAAASAGEVAIFDTGGAFTCPVRPHNHKEND